MTDAPKNDKNIEVRLKNVRLSFAWLFAPQPRKDDDGKIKGWSYGGSFLIPKDTAEGKVTIAAVKDALRLARDSRWPPTDGVPKKFKADKMCLRDGDEEDWDGYAGHMYVSASRPVKQQDSKNPVALIDSRKGADGKFPRLTEASGKLYSGCYVNAILRIYGYDGSKHGYANRLNASLEGVQFLRHGDAFGAKPLDADSAFEDEGPEDGEAFDGGSKTAAAGGADDDLL
jgi:hypothetical protein